GGDLPVIDLQPRLEQVQAGNRKRCFAHVDAGHLGAASSHGLTQNAATTADVEYLLACKRDVFVDPVDPQRIDLVQWLELAFAIPPAMGEGFEFGYFGLVDIAHGSFRFES